MAIPLFWYQFNIRQCFFFRQKYVEQEIARRKGVLVDEDPDMKKKYVLSLMSDHRLQNVGDLDRKLYGAFA